MLNLKERRTKQQIYTDILNSINNSSDEDLKITNIQLLSKLSYDKVKIRLDELEKCKLIQYNPKIQVTERGKLFIHDSNELSNNLEAIYKIYLSVQSINDENMINEIIKNDGKITHVQNNEHITNHKIKEYKLIQNVMQATIDELSKV